MSDVKETIYGSISPKSVKSFEKQNEMIRKNIAFVLRKEQVEYFLKGILQFSGLANKKYKIHGIEIEKKFPFCIDGESDDAKLFHINCKFMLLIPQHIDIIDIDKDTGAILNEKVIGETEGKYKTEELVLVKFKNCYKAGTIRKCGTIIGRISYEIELAEKLNSKHLYVVTEDYIVAKLLNNKGSIILNDFLELEEDNDIYGHDINETVTINKDTGILQWKGRVNGLKCVGIDKGDGNDEDFSYLSGRHHSYWTMIPIPENVNSHRNSIVDKNNYKDKTPPTSIKKAAKISSSSDERLSSGEYHSPRYIIGDIKDTQLRGDHNICTIYTMVHSLFIFNEMFEKLLFEIHNPDEIKRMLAQDIVIPILREKEPKSKSFEELSKLVKSKNDDIIEGLLESIGFNFKMIKNESEINILKIKLSETIVEKQRSICDFIQLYCIMEETFILKPQKCLILEFSKEVASKILVTSKLDITKVIYQYNQFCSVCSSDAYSICKDCSIDKMEIIYFCKDHQKHCKHDKKGISNRNSGESLKGKIEMELISVLCRKNSDYYTYVKSNDVKETWMCFKINQAGRSVKHLELKSYFNKSDTERIKISDTEILNMKTEYDILEKHKYMAIYKYAPLEYYWNDI